MSDWWYWSWVLTIIGAAGFWLTARKVWWGWWVNVANQATWLAYAIVTRQWGFLGSVALYTFVFLPAAIRWTREHFEKPCTCRVELGSGAGLDTVHPAGCERHARRS